MDELQTPATHLELLRKIHGSLNALNSAVAIIAVLLLVLHMAHVVGPAPRC